MVMWSWPLGHPTTRIHLQCPDPRCDSPIWAWVAAKSRGVSLLCKVVRASSKIVRASPSQSRRETTAQSAHTRQYHDTPTKCTHSTYREHGVGELREGVGGNVQLSLCNLDHHLVVLGVRLLAEVFLANARATPVVEDGDLQDHFARQQSTQ